MSYMYMYMYPSQFERPVLLRDRSQLKMDRRETDYQFLLTQWVYLLRPNTL